MKNFIEAVSKWNNKYQITTRLKSKVVWLATLSLIYFVVKNWIGFEIPMWDEFVDKLIYVLIAFGIINNPTEKDKF